MSQFISDLVVKLVEDDIHELWELVQPLRYQSDRLGGIIEAPVSFRTDFCSVPRLPVIYECLGNRTRRAGTIHDYLYTVKAHPRKLCDDLLEEMVKVCGMSHIEAEMMYRAVRQFGGPHYGIQK